jgi:predicted dehydrogenase
MPSPLNIGIIGAGFIARTHAHAVSNSLTRATLAGVAGGSRAQALAADFQTRLFDSIESLAASPLVDAVIIATPHHLHRDHALLCAAHGKHVLLEKPMATTVAQCHEIINAFARRGHILMIAFSQRFRQSNRHAYHIIRRGDIGDIRMIQDFALVPNGLAAYPTWQQHPANLGVLFGYGIHTLDKLRWFLGSEAETVSACILRSSGNIETSTMATISWANGAITSVWSSVDLGAPAFPSSAFRSLIVGSQGLLDVDGYGEVRLSLAGAPWQTMFVQPPIDWRGSGMFAEARMGSFNAQDQSFVDAVLDGRTPPVSGEDGFRAVEIALAAYRAADTNQVVHISRG